MLHARGRGTDVPHQLGVGGALAAALAVAGTACLAAPPPPSPTASPPDGAGVEVVAEDPFGDGTAVAPVFAYRGWIHIGPSRSGDRLMRLDPGGNGELEEVTLALPRDATGNTSRNQSSAPYRSIGYTGCTPDVDCGPDDEDGGGLFATAALAGGELLIAGGARSAGDVDYVYVTDDSGADLAFRYVDLSAATGPASRGFSALHAFADRIYLGFPDTGAERPYLLALLRAPAAPPGLDAANGTDVINLDAHSMPGLATETNALIDAIADFGGGLYVANAGGWMRSTVEHPGPYGVAAADWTDATPSAPDYVGFDSMLTGKTADLRPADRAVAGFASHQGRLYAARNTTGGPQLWWCDPAASPPAAACDPDDWSLVAGLGEDDDRAAVSLLIATGGALYVGIDRSSGFRLFRATSAAESALDFEAVAGPGGDSALTSIFSAAAVGGADVVYLVAGDGNRPLSLLRVGG